jgi:hypothetical protein
MLLKELLGIKKFKHKSPLEIYKWISDNFKEGSFEPVGHGASAIVLKRGNVAYKFWAYDSAYDMFVKYIQQNQRNKFLPKLLSPVKTLPGFMLPNTSDRVKYIKMELLKPVSSNTKIDNISFEDIMNTVLDIGFDDRQELFDKIDEEYPLSSKDTDLFINTLLAIKELNPDFNIDITGYDSNIMDRDGTPVIVDPLVDYNSLQYNDFMMDFEEEFGE